MEDRIKRSQEEVERSLQLKQFAYQKELELKAQEALAL
jgi:hypothetical protein